MPPLQLVFAAIGIRLAPQAADIDGAVVLRLLDHLLRSAALLLHVRLDHLGRQVRSQPAVFTALEQHTDNHVGIAARRESYEPAVLRQVGVVLVLGTVLQ